MKPVPTPSAQLRATHTDLGSEFVSRVGDALNRAAILTSVPAPELREAALPCLDAVLSQLLATLEMTLDARSSREAAELCRATLELTHLRAELRAHAESQRNDALDLDDRMSTLRGVHEALSAMHRVVVPEQLYDLATRELCESCGFDRAILWSVSGEELIPQSVHFRHDPDWARQILDLGRGAGRPQLRDMVLEREMVRVRAPALVLDAQNDPRAATTMARATRTDSYVAAPLQPEGRVIGFLHADYYHSGRTVDETDRNTLWAFAEGYGYALERMLLRMHVAEQREQLMAVAQSTTRIVRDLGDAEMALERSGEAAYDTSPRLDAARFPEPVVDPSHGLTPRELEVLRLLADGTTNAGIARQLYIAESTAKAHVKHILRKLGATNRVDAVSKYLRGLRPE